MSWRHSAVAISALLAFAFGPVSPASAATIVGGSGVLTQSQADQLQTWLGEGSLVLLNAFSKTFDGSTSAAFHAHSDGHGRTFSIMEVTDLNYGGTSVIGGYNPLSWSSNGEFNTDPTDETRTAFIFNLTLGTRQNQITGDQFPPFGFGPGQYQTYNHPFYGPTFGAGYDISVDAGLSGGYLDRHSYAAPFPNVNVNVLGLADGTNVSYGRIDVFVIVVPEPFTAALTALGLAALVLVRRATAK